MKRLILALSALLLLLVTLFLVIAAHGAESNDPCFDQLLLQWNSFAQDANSHMHTVEAKPSDRDKTHRRLDREWEAVKALACW